jgi:hypothetical protein
MRSDLLSSHLYRKSSPRFCCALEVLYQVIFFYLRTGISFSRSWDCSSYTLYSISLENILCIHLILTHGCRGWYNDLCRDKSGLLEQVVIIIFSLHLGEPLVFGSCNAFIHESSIHCSSSRLPVLLLDLFYWVHIRLVIFWFLILCSSSCFSLASWVHGVSYRFHALEIPLLPFIIGSRIWMDN